MHITLYFLAQTSPAHLKNASPLGSLSALNRARQKTKEHLGTHLTTGLTGLNYLSISALPWFSHMKLSSAAAGVRSCTDQESALTSSMPPPSFCEQSTGKAKPYGRQPLHATSPQDHKMPFIILLIQMYP